jgi:hypothetical protein
MYISVCGEILWLQSICYLYPLYVHPTAATALDALQLLGSSLPATFTLQFLSS